MFKIGQKVVCVEPYSSHFGTFTLKRDVVYEVRAIGIKCKCCNDNVNISVGFVDGIGTKCYLCNTILSDNEAFHRASRFRLVEHSFGEKLAEEIQEEINQEQLIEATCLI